MKKLVQTKSIKHVTLYPCKKWICVNNVFILKYWHLVIQKSIVLLFLFRTNVNMALLTHLLTHNYLIWVRLTNRTCKLNIKLMVIHSFENNVWKYYSLPEDWVFSLLSTLDPRFLWQRFRSHIITIIFDWITFFLSPLFRQLYVSIITKPGINLLENGKSIRSLQLMNLYQEILLRFFFAIGRKNMIMRAGGSNRIFTIMLHITI